MGLIATGAGGGGGGGSGMREPRGASGSCSVVLSPGMINPSVPIRSIRMKFAVLIGLTQVGEVSNQGHRGDRAQPGKGKSVLLFASQPHSRPAPPGSRRSASLEAQIAQPVLPAGALPARCPSHATSLLSPGALLPPEFRAQLNIAYYHALRP